MMHEIEDIEQERLRLSQRPSAQEVPPVVGVFDVRTICPVAEFGDRVRSVLDPALRLAVSQRFEGEDLPVDAIPGWFAAVARESVQPAPDFAVQGAERYAAAIGRGAWDLQEWLYQFDPESEFRGWAWWDLTQSGEREARVWVDTWGESFFACDELRWLAHVSGAVEVNGPTLERSEAWIAAAQP
ncbi:hypothetical protein ABS735_15725 [Streptomyces sp. MMCC 100]|uniref:hypothetical protein n=1 Tax=Streptomyces sp. MMCC 100 TaxID=3163555 RepID=UPI003598F982